MLPAFRALLPSETFVHRHPVKPGRETGVAAKIFDAMVGADQSLLGEVFGVAHRAGHAICQSMYHMLMALDQFLERLTIPCLASCHPVPIVRCVAHCASFIRVRTFPGSNPLKTMKRKPRSFDASKITVKLHKPRLPAGLPAKTIVLPGAAPAGTTALFFVVADGF